MFDTSSEIKLIKRGLLPIEGINYVFDLYLPFIGSNSTFLYMFLANKVKQNNLTLNFGDLVNESLLSLQDFLLSKKTLESIGLISFFKNKNEEKYILAINDAYTPKNFFNNLIFKSLFIETVGEEKAKEIIKKYEICEDFKQFEDISAKIVDTFSLDFDPKKYQIDKNISLEGMNKNEIRDNFSDVKLLNYLKKNTQIRPDALSDQELDFIHKIASLYGMSEKDVGGLVSSCFIMQEKVGNKLDKEKLKRLAKTFVKGFKINRSFSENKVNINSNSDVAQIVKIYESTPPILFLKSKQNGIDVIDADKNLINDLSFELGLSNGMINALLDYVLKNKNGELSKNYVMKIASTLIRKGCKNSLDCLRVFATNKKSSSNLSKNIVVENKPKTVSEDENLSIKASDLKDDDDYKFFED